MVLVVSKYRATFVALLILELCMLGFKGSVVGYSSSQRREIGKRLPCWCLEHN